MRCLWMKLCKMMVTAWWYDKMLMLCDNICDDDVGRGVVKVMSIWGELLWGKGLRELLCLPGQLQCYHRLTDCKKHQSIQNIYTHIKKVFFENRYAPQMKRYWNVIAWPITWSWVTLILFKWFCGTAIPLSLVLDKVIKLYRILLIYNTQ